MQQMQRRPGFIIINLHLQKLGFESPLTLFHWLFIAWMMLCVLFWREIAVVSIGFSSLSPLGYSLIHMYIRLSL
ncbi:hypothetical protein BDR26DRAFT_853812 [Obelidium mucronatum]|nr:hypothetical protein BDR26DRAFT_853812 [Obelidium mucronatum]